MEEQNLWFTSQETLTWNFASPLQKERKKLEEPKIIYLYRGEKHSLGKIQIRSISIDDNLRLTTVLPFSLLYFQYGLKCLLPS